MFRDTLNFLKKDAVDARQQLSSFQTKVQAAIGLIDGSKMSRAKALLKVDNEYLRRTLPLGSDCALEDCRQVYAESVEAMKMLSLQQKKATNYDFVQADEINENGFSVYRPQKGKLEHFSQSGYRSNEADECQELAKISAHNAVACHESLIEELETT